MTAQYDLRIRQGQDEAVVVRWLEDDLPVDLSGATGLFQIRTTTAAGSAIFEATPTLDDTTNVSLDIPGADSASWLIPAARPLVVGSDGVLWVDLGVYDLKLTLADDTIVRLVQGRVWISPEVSR